MSVYDHLIERIRLDAENERRQQRAEQLANRR